MQPYDQRLEETVSQPHWYVVYTFPNQEKKVAAEIGRRSVEFYLPLYSFVRRRKDRRVKIELPLFPGYIFVHLALSDRLRVLQVGGVVRLVGFSSCATPVPDIEITRIRDILNQGLPTDPHRYLATGQRVRVKYGPLVGLEGFIVRRKKRTRFVVIIESIRRAISVEVGELELEAIAPRSRENSLVCAHG
ncbi:MAG: UpxY family transcription antiterminator [Candidatus Acidiferrum sp.]